MSENQETPLPEADADELPEAVEAAFRFLDHARWVESPCALVLPAAGGGSTSCARPGRPMNIYELRCYDIAVRVIDGYLRDADQAIREFLEDRADGKG